MTKCGANNGDTEWCIRWTDYWANGL